MCSAWTLGLELSFMCPHPQGFGLSVAGGARAVGDKFLSLGEAYISNLSLLLCMEDLKKFVVVVVVVVGWWWWGGGGGGGLDQF